MKHSSAGGRAAQFGDLTVTTLPVGPVAANAYVLSSGDDCVIVDPGAEGATLAAEVARLGLVPRAVWLTHAHFDHVGGIAEFLGAGGRQAEELPVLMHPLDRPLLEHAVEAAARWGIRIEAPPSQTTDVAHGQSLTLGGLSASVLHTPGHAPGHVGYYFAAAGLLLSGDALFAGSIGRTDLPLADHDQLLRSIRTEFLSLPDDTAVLPGHGGPTTIGAERSGNPFL